MFTYAADALDLHVDQFAQNLSFSEEQSHGPGSNHYCSRKSAFKRSKQARKRRPGQASKLNAKNGGKERRKIPREKKGSS